MKKSIRISLGIFFAAALAGLLYLHSRLSIPHIADGKSTVDSVTAHAMTHTSPRKFVVPQPAGPTKRFPVGDDGTVEVPTRYQLPGVARVHTAANFDEWIEQYPAADRARIKAFDTRYNGVYEIASPQQIAWMAQNGYPMPEDLIAAQGIDDQTLRDLADHGNDKAGFLYHDRYLDRLGNRHVNQLDLSNPDDQVLARALDADQFLESASAFKGYVEAADAFTYADPVVQKARLIAGLTRASEFGDFRAVQVLSQYVDQGMVSDAEFGIATQIYVDANMDRSLVPGAKCPNFTVFGPIPMK